MVDLINKTLAQAYDAHLYTSTYAHFSYFLNHIAMDCANVSCAFV